MFDVYFSKSDKMAENLEILEKRLAELENRIFGEANKDAAYPKEKAPDEGIVDTLARMNTQVNAAVATRPKIQTMIKRLGQLEAVLEPSQMENLMLSQEAKADIILAEEEVIHQQTQNLQQVKDMADVLDSEHVKAVPALQDKLQELSAVHLKQQDGTMELSEDIKVLLQQYNNTVTLLSKQFVQWDELVTKIEVASQGTSSQN